MEVASGWYADPWGQSPLRWWDGTQWTGLTHSPDPRSGASITVQPRSESVRQSGGSLDSLLRDADRVAVIDVETTGLFSADRVVEVAVVTVDRHGNIVDEFESLTNPLRDPGPTWLHGLSSSTLTRAPLFEDIAEHIAALLNGAVVAAHNLRFDQRLLNYEFDRVGIDVDWGTGLDTLHAVGCKLGTACADHGIALNGAHRALNDARATAELLLRVVDAFAECRPATAWPVSPTIPQVLTRDGFTEVDFVRPHVLDLACDLHSEPDIAPYVDLLDVAVADLKFDADERRELALLADDLGLDERRRMRAHKQFLAGLIDAALDDGVVSDEEFDQLCRTAALLDIDDEVVCARTNPYRLKKEHLKLQPGMRVCFTGAAQRPDGQPLERTELQALARQHGLEPVGSVTKANCQLLVASDPTTLSSKARSAQKFGTPIASVTDFLEALRTRKPLTVSRLPAKGVALVCTSCGHSWMASRRTRTPVCTDCRQKTKPPAARNDGSNAANTAARSERLARCAQAVELQASGSTRQQIGEELGVSVESVAELLRDGRFYANPESDPDRLELAKQAWDARKAGMTRAEFSSKTGLSKNKAQECWKDADILVPQAAWPAERGHG